MAAPTVDESSKLSIELGSSTIIYPYGSARVGLFMTDSKSIGSAIIPTDGLAGSSVFYLEARTLRNLEVSLIELESRSVDNTPIMSTTLLLSAIAPNIYRSSPIVAIDKDLFPEEGIAFYSNGVTIKAQSVVRADGESKARIDISVTDPSLGGKLLRLCPYSNAVVLSDYSFLINGIGVFTSYAISLEQGTKFIKIILQDGEKEIELGTVRILFIANVIPILAEPGGFINATLFCFDGKPPLKNEAWVLGGEVQIKPSYEEIFKADSKVR